jgi:hypothetical protein
MDAIDRIRNQSQEQARFKNEESRHSQVLVGLENISETQMQAMRQLVAFLNGHVTKTEVVNQLKSVATPDVEKVVKAVEQLAEKIPPQLDLTSLEKSIQAVEAQLKLIPKEHQELPEQKEEVRVTNLDEIDFTTLEKAIKGISITTPAPVVNVPQADVNVDVDLKPIQKGLQDLLKAVTGISFEAPATDLSKVEKKLDKSNELLKEIVDKPMGGGGGGGHGTPYVDGTGRATYVELTIDGKIPVEAGATSTYESRNDTTTDTNLVYLGKALPGSLTSDAAWQIKRYNKSAGHMSFADDVTTFTKVWDNRSSYGY